MHMVTLQESYRTVGKHTADDYTVLSRTIRLFEIVAVLGLYTAGEP